MCYTLLWVALGIDMKKAIILGAIALFPHASHAQMSAVICDDSLRLEQQLFGARGATMLGYGLNGPDSLIEVWVEPDSGDWTLVQNYANGTSCVLATGESWEIPASSEDPA